MVKAIIIEMFYFYLLNRFVYNEEGNISEYYKKYSNLN